MPSIIVDPKLCSRCGVCSEVCPMRIIDRAGADAGADAAALPATREGKAAVCLRCGHCEALCPSRALRLDYRADEPHSAVAMAPEVEAPALASYMKLRRSARHFLEAPVPRDRIEALLDLARYAPTANNGQPVGWIVIREPVEVRRLAGLVIEWLESAEGVSGHLSAAAPGLVRAWARGEDPICRKAPHLLVAHLPEGAASDDAVIALSHFELAAPAFGVGACWAGFLSMAAAEYAPLREALALPAGRRYAGALFFGRPRYRPSGIPRREPLSVDWR
jgi:nitroreductase/NAD-dependent dihydropyrimidine dehydrogenase PreA subunit